MLNADIPIMERTFRVGSLTLIIAAAQPIPIKIKAKNQNISNKLILIIYFY